MAGNRPYQHLKDQDLYQRWQRTNKVTQGPEYYELAGELNNRYVVNRLMLKISALISLLALVAVIAFYNIGKDVNQKGVIAAIILFSLATTGIQFSLAMPQSKLRKDRDKGILEKSDSKILPANLFLSPADIEELLLREPPHTQFHAKLLKAKKRLHLLFP